MATSSNSADKSFRSSKEPIMLADLSSPVTIGTCQSMQRNLLSTFSAEINKSNEKISRIQESLFGVTIGGTIKEPGLIKSVNELVTLQRKKTSLVRWVVERIGVPIFMVVLTAYILGMLPF